MNNEEKILSMLDMIASELQDVKQNSVTKDEFQGFRQEVNHRFDEVDRRFEDVYLRFDKIDERFQDVYLRFDMIDGRLNTIDGRLDGLDRRLSNVEENMVTKNDLHTVLVESQKDVMAMLKIIDTKLNAQEERMDVKFFLLNERIFRQEAQMELFQRKNA